MTTATARMQGWVDIAATMPPAEAADYLRRGLQSTALTRAVEASPLPEDVKQMVFDIEERHDAGLAWDTLRRCELILVAAGHDRVRAA